MFLSAARTVPGTFFNGSIEFCGVLRFPFCFYFCRTNPILTAPCTAVLLSVKYNELDDEAKATLTEAANAKGVALEL